MHFLIQTVVPNRKSLKIQHDYHFLALLSSVLALSVISHNLNSDSIVNCGSIIEMCN